MQCDKPWAKGWGKPNWRHNIVEKAFEVNKKKGSLVEQTTAYPHLASHNILGMPDANKKTNKRWC